MPSWITIRVQITTAGRYDVSHHKAGKQPVSLAPLLRGKGVMPENDSTGGAKPPLIFKFSGPGASHTDKKEAVFHIIGWLLSCE